MFTSALIVAIFTYILTLIGGRNVKASLALLGTISFITPFALIALSGTIALLGANLTSSQIIATNTTNALFSAYTNQLPDYFMGEIAGILVGGVGGFITKLIKECR